MMNNNIILKSEKIKFINTLNHNVQSGDKINSTNGKTQLQNNETNIEHKTAGLS